MPNINDAVQTADAIFVGAGPVGLYSAIQAKPYQPDLKIIMLERHETYLRHHILRIDKDSYINSHPNPEFQKVLEPLKGMVPTSTIESALLEYAKSIGIEVLHHKVDSIKALKEETSNARYIIGSDGARSLVRREVFNDENYVDTNLQHIVEVKYKAKAHQQPSGEYLKTSGLDTFESLTTLSQCDHFITENIGKVKNGEVPISLFFFVDQQTYDEVKALNTKPGKRLGLLDISTV